MYSTNDIGNIAFFCFIVFAIFGLIGLAGIGPILLGLGVIFLTSLFLAK